MIALSTAAARAVADVTSGLILGSIEIARPPERVFRALASEELAKWWGSDDLYWTKKWSGELRTGGWWKTEGVGSDGKPFSVGGEFLEVDPPKKLVQTWRYDWDPTKSTTTITYRLEPIDGGKGTRLIIRHEGFTPQNAAACADHARGWERVFGWLAAYLEKETSK